MHTEVIVQKRLQSIYFCIDSIHDTYVLYRLKD